MDSAMCDLIYTMARSGSLGFMIWQGWLEEKIVTPGTVATDLDFCLFLSTKLLLLSVTVLSSEDTNIHVRLKKAL
jgi:hypothetical protein